MLTVLLYCFIFYLISSVCLLIIVIPALQVAGGWSLSQLSCVEGGVAAWTNNQIVGVPGTERDKHSHSHSQPETISSCKSTWLHLSANCEKEAEYLQRILCCEISQIGLGFMSLEMRY